MAAILDWLKIINDRIGLTETTAKNPKLDKHQQATLNRHAGALKVCKTVGIMANAQAYARETHAAELASQQAEHARLTALKAKLTPAPELERWGELQKESKTLASLYRRANGFRIQPQERQRAAEIAALEDGNEPPPKAA